MSIYTKTGDKGSTALVGGSRVSKADLRVDTYGTVDELNAALSLAERATLGADNRALLEAVQYQLFYLGAELATDPAAELKGPAPLRIGGEHIAALEQAIDRCMASLPPVRGFVLPGRSEAGSRLHLARTIARRAERRMVELATHTSLRPALLQYLNRLSDCLYALARQEDQLASTEQVISEVIRRYRAALDAETPAPQTQHAAATTHTATAHPDHCNPGFAVLHQLLKQAIKAASELGVPVVIAVVDRHGQPILTYRMPDSLLVSLDLAPKKAYTAAALKTATHLLGSAIQPGAPLFQLEASSGGKVVTFGGGYPLYWKGRLAGGLGISGGTVEQDMQIAEAAMQGLQLGNAQ